MSECEHRKSHVTSPRDSDVSMIDRDKEQLAAELRGSFLRYTQYMFRRLTGRDFFISHPNGRESHHIIIAKELTKVLRREMTTDCLGICVPPRMGKSVLLSMWVTWCYTHYADCNFLYISYGHDLAKKHTSFIRQIMSSNEYGYLFDVHLKPTSRAQDKFSTINNGIVCAFGAGGAVVGQDAGLPNLDRFAGAVIIDDPHKIDEATSDTKREAVLENYSQTIIQRAPDGVPILFIGQRIHEQDLAAFLQSGKDVKSWSFINLKALDENENALCPEIHTEKLLKTMREKSPYVFASQFQQDPSPAGGGLFKAEYFVELDEEPEFLATFITADTAETDKSWNDATVFSFWGVYHIPDTGQMTLGLHWLDCVELRIEPRELEQAFLDFYANCARNPMPPRIAAIEKKSTGVTLTSVLKNLRGISIREIERNRSSGSKSQRFIDSQWFLASKLVSISSHAHHKDLVISHMTKITANNSHRWDDIADTCADAIKLVYIDKTIYYNSSNNKQESVATYLQSSLMRRIKAGAARYGNTN